MKTLLIIRHAKSNWDITSINDFERSLNDRGKKDAPEMAQRLLNKKIGIDAFISSPAKRAKRTAELFCSVYDRKEEEIIFISALYHANVKTFYETIEQIDDSYNSVALFSHNSGITLFVNELVESVNIDNMPTCAVFAIKANVTKWKDFNNAVKDFMFFDYPKLS
jgi:phosphohistidine phosphatase